MVKKLNAFEATKLAVKEAGVKFITGYAGCIASSFLNELGNITQALNESVALDMAHVYSYLGKRSLTIMKNAGLNQAALPFRNICDLGVNAGLVIIVTDDVNAEMSENRQDSRIYFEVGKTLLLEPKTPNQMYKMVREAYRLSEHFKLPILIRVTNSLGDKNNVQEVKREKADTKVSSKRENNQLKWVLNPLTAGDLNKNHEKRYKAIENYVEKSPFNEIHIGSGEAVMFSQALSKNEREILKKHSSFMAVSTFPVPRKKILDFVGKVPSFEVIDSIDSGESTLFNEISIALGNIKSEKIIDREYGWRGLHVTNKTSLFNYTSLFELIKNRKTGLIVGDFGSYTLARGSPIEYALHYSGAIASAVGAVLAGEKNVYAVVGDGGFSAGIEGILEAERKKVKLNIVVIENGGIYKKEKINLDLKEVALANGATYAKRVHISELSKKDFDEMESHKGIAVLLVDYTDTAKKWHGYIVEELKTRAKNLFSKD